MEPGGWESGGSSALIDLRLSRLSLVLAAAAAAGAFVNLAGLSLVRDVLLGVLFILWTVLMDKVKTERFPSISMIRRLIGLTS